MATGETEVTSREDLMNISKIFQTLKTFKSETLNHFDSCLKPLGEQLNVFWFKELSNKFVLVQMPPLNLI